MTLADLRAPGFLCSAGAVAWGGLIVAGAYTLPVYGTSCAGDCGAERLPDTLIGVNGAAVLPIVAAPLALALVAFVLLHLVCARGTRYARGAAGSLAGLLWLASLLGALTIGLFIVPAALLLTAAAITTRSPSPA